MKIEFLFLAKSFAAKKEEKIDEVKKELKIWMQRMIIMVKRPQKVI